MPAHGFKVALTEPKGPVLNGLVPDHRASREAVPGPGALLSLIRDTGAATRRDLADRTGLGRSSIAQRVESLMASGLIVQHGSRASTGGRPALVLSFNPDAGVVLAADLGTTHARVAMTNLDGEPLVERAADMPIAAGPDHVLGWVEECFDAMLRDGERTADDVRAVGIGVPGPVEFATGRPMHPPIMPGWDGFPVAERLAGRYRVPVLVDNDVNIMAVGEHQRRWAATDELMFVKVGTGIGAGFIANGHIYRGSQGAAGDIGHMRVSGHDDVVCHCGNVGCLEAVAGGGALVRQARELGLDAADSRELVALVRAQDPAAVRLVRQAGRILGEALAHLVNAFNPAVIVVGGDVAGADEQLFAGIRELVYQRSTPLATRHLQIVRSELDDRAGMTGAALMAIDHALAPERVDVALAGDGAPPAPLRSAQ